MSQFSMCGGYESWVRVATATRQAGDKFDEPTERAITLYLTYLPRGRGVPDYVRSISELNGSQIAQLAQRILSVGNPVIWSVKLEATNAFQEDRIKGRKRRKYDDNLKMIQDGTFTAQPYPLFIEASLIGGPSEVYLRLDAAHRLLAHAKEAKEMLVQVCEK